MKSEKTITICGKEVKMLYCAATETGFEKLASKSMGAIDFNSQEDLLRLSVAAIIAAYQRDGEEAPIDAKVILYEAKPSEIVEMFKSVFELRAEWYDIPAVLEQSIKADNASAADAGSDNGEETDEQQKNA